MRYRLVFSAFATALVIGTFAVPGAAHAGTDGARHCAKPTRLWSYSVTTEWSSKVYGNNDTAKVTVTVTRPGPEDPLEGGIPLPALVSIPEEGVDVSTTIMTRVFPPIYGRGITDAQGKVTLKIPLDRVKKTGPQEASTYVSKWTNEGGCPDIEEWGWRYDRPAFVLKP